MPTVRAAVQAVTTAPPILTSGAAPDLPITQFGEDLLTYLVTTALMKNAPVAYQVGVLFGIIVPPKDAAPDPPIPESGAPIRRSMKRAKIDFAMIGALLSDPIAALRETYLPDGLAFGDETDRAARLLLGRIGDLCAALGIHSANGLLATFGIDPAMAPIEFAGVSTAGITLAGHMPSVSGTIADDQASVDPDQATFGVDIALSSPDRGGLGLVVVPRGQAKFATPVGKHWVLGADLSATGGAFAVGPNGVITQAGDSATVKFGVGLASIPAESGLSFLVGSTTGTRLELGSLIIGIDATLGVGQPSPARTVRPRVSPATSRATREPTQTRRTCASFGPHSAFWPNCPSRTWNGISWAPRSGRVPARRLADRLRNSAAGLVAPHTRDRCTHRWLRLADRRTAPANGAHCSNPGGRKRPDARGSGRSRLRARAISAPGKHCCRAAQWLSQSSGSWSSREPVRCGREFAAPADRSATAGRRTAGTVSRRAAGLPVRTGTA